MACQIAARILKKGAGMQWRHLVYSDLRTYTIHNHNLQTTNTAKYLEASIWTAP